MANWWKAEKPRVERLDHFFLLTVFHMKKWNSSNNIWPFHWNYDKVQVGNFFRFSVSSYSSLLRSSFFESSLFGVQTNMVWEIRLFCVIRRATPNLRVSSEEVEDKNALYITLIHKQSRVLWSTDTLFPHMHCNGKKANSIEFIQSHSSGTHVSID